RGVVFCSEDLLLIKGPARVRRRFMDLLLTQTLPAYLPLIQRYTQALRARNALLKQFAPDNAALEGFTRELVLCGTQIIGHRRQLVPQLLPLAQSAYNRMVSKGEELRLEYLPSVKSDFAAELSAARQRERMQRMTLTGPHRDDLELLLNDRRISQFGSEGQKRTLAIALKMAQAEFLGRHHGQPPILLIDDVMGELDRSRRNAFLPLLDQARQARGQVFMTCTELNLPMELGDAPVRWEVRDGALRRFVTCGMPPVR
ncbi:MAG: DNA replication and repair protein RecF, partial [Candidatus Omnitrophica bacterium]|nr:DNA replication and repair protein RecF [Candidatus Omnitrophota bacterium]